MALHDPGPDLRAVALHQLRRICHAVALAAVAAAGQSDGVAAGDSDVAMVDVDSSGGGTCGGGANCGGAPGRWEAAVLATALGALRAAARDPAPAVRDVASLALASVQRWPSVAAAAAARRDALGADSGCARILRRLARRQVILLGGDLSEFGGWVIYPHSVTGHLR
jgi:hypothetical protein